MADDRTQPSLRLRAARRLGFPKLLGPADEHWEYLLLASLVVGLTSGLSAVGLRRAVHELFSLLDGFPVEWRILTPALGALLGVLLVQRVFRESAGHGVPDVIRAVGLEGGRMPVRSIFSRWLGSLVNVGAGGSAGLEGPIVHSAGALGSTIGSWMRLDDRRRSILVGCGVAGGIAAIFDAPMTGVIFSLEVILGAWGTLSVVPIIVSAVAATQLSRALLGHEHSFLHAPFEMRLPDLFACAALGLVAGLTSVTLSRGIGRVHGLARRLPGEILAPFLFGLLVGVIGYFLPAGIGEGYDEVQHLLDSRATFGLALGLACLAAKLLSTSLTLGSEAPGGIFAPCLVSGAFLGASFHDAISELIPGWTSIAPVASYAIVGMSGLVAGVMHAPLTGIFLVMEVTDGYDVILPLMIVSVLSLLVARRFELHSLYTNELAASGELARPGTDRSIARTLTVRDAMELDVVVLREDQSLASLKTTFQRTSQEAFPVEDGDGRLVGILDLATVRAQLLDPAFAQITLVETVMDSEAPTLHPGDPAQVALDIFESSERTALAVVDENGGLQGLVRKEELLEMYRRELLAQDQSIEG